MTFGQNLKKLRKAAGLSQKQLGLACGFDAKSGENTVQHWEHDRREPSIQDLRPMAKALNVTLDQLIPEDDEEDDQL